MAAPEEIDIEVDGPPLVDLAAVRRILLRVDDIQGQESSVPINLALQTGLRVHEQMATDNRSTVDLLQEYGVESRHRGNQ